MGGWVGGVENEVGELRLDVVVRGALGLGEGGREGEVCTCKYICEHPSLRLSFPPSLPPSLPPL